MKTGRIFRNSSNPNGPTGNAALCKPDTKKTEPRERKTFLNRKISLPFSNRFHYFSLMETESIFAFAAEK